MPNRETMNQHDSELVNPNILAPGDDETLEPGELTGEDDTQDHDQTDAIPKVAAEADEGAEDEDTAEETESDEDDDAAVDDAVEDGEEEDGSGGHV